MDAFPQEPPSSAIPPVDKDSCALLGQTGLLVQAIMAVLVLGSLMIKRSRENPRRPWPVWLADVGKQVIGQAFLHFTNVVFSTLFSHASRGDACTAYFLSIFVDCTLGVLIIYSTLRIFSHVLIQRMHLKGIRSGQYYEKQVHTDASTEEAMDRDVVHSAGQAEGRPSIDSLEEGGKPASSTSASQPTQEARFQFSWWGKQLMVYLASLVVMKLAILGFFWIPAVLAVGDWMLSWLGEDTKVIFVLMIFPLAMNAIQFLLIDTILKSSTPFSEVTAVEGQGPASTFSRRTSEDRHGRDEEEGRAFLLHDTTHDELDPGAKDATPLPDYYEPSGSLSQNSKMQKHGSASSELPADDKQGWSSFDAEEEDDDYSTTPRPGSKARAASSADSPSNDANNPSAIPLRIVPSHSRRASQDSSVGGFSGDQRRESEPNEWDWLSDDGSTSRQNDQNDEESSTYERNQTQIHRSEPPLAKGSKAD